MNEEPADPRPGPAKDGERPRPVARLTRFVPALSWARAYQRAWLTRDAIAGFTIWGLLVPEMIAYASLAGLPPQAGLYTLLASLVLYAIFGTSRQLVVAGTSASAVLVYSAVTALHPKDMPTYTGLAAGFIILTGVLFLASGLFRLGFITQFLSRPVMEGFIFGLAIFVTVGQLPKIFGIAKGPGDTIRQFIHLLGHLGGASWTTFAVGIIALGLLFALDRVPRLPGGLVVLLAAILVSTVFHLDHHGVATVGKVAAGLPSVHAVRLSASNLWVLLPSAAGMLLVIFSEALAAAQTFADKHGYRLDPSQDMIALGLANIVSGLLGGLAAGGSLSQTAVNDGAGARSELSPVIAAVLSLITVVALTPLFTNLPEAVLAAMIIYAVSRLMKVAEMRRFYMLVPREFWLGMITLLGVITLDVLPGLVIGVVASILLLVYRASRPEFSVMGSDPDLPGAYEDVHRHPDAEPIRGVLIIRPDAPLFYANSQALRDTVTEMVRSSKDTIGTVILDLDANDELDITSTEALAKLIEELARRDVRVALAHVHATAADMIRRSASDGNPGPERIFPNLDSAVTWASTSPVSSVPRAEEE
jgi:SulP family sulfate permease